MRFWFHRETQKKALAELCLRLMADDLRRHICDLQAPGTRLSDVDGNHIMQRLPPSLAYSWCHWVHHVQDVNALLTESNSVFVFLHKYVFHWLKALSLQGRLPDAVYVLSSLHHTTVKISFAASFSVANSIARPV